MTGNDFWIYAGIFILGVICGAKAFGFNTPDPIRLVIGKIAHKERTTTSLLGGNSVYRYYLHITSPAWRSHVTTRYQVTKDLYKKAVEGGIIGCPMTVGEAYVSFDYDDSNGDS